MGHRADPGLEGNVTEFGAPRPIVLWRIRHPAAGLQNIRAWCPLPKPIDIAAVKRAAQLSVQALVRELAMGQTSCP